VRRLTLALVFAAGLASLSGCRRDQVIRPEPTEEGAVGLSTAINMGDPKAAVQLVRGFHQIEQGAWRWSMGRFTLMFRVPPAASAKKTTLVLRGTAPEPVIQRLGTVTLTALLAQDPIGQVTISKPGPFTLEAGVPPAALQSETVTVDFVLDKYLSAGILDPRELGIIVSTAGFETR